ncbi:MAG: hypothetical protein ACT6QU_14730 [Aliihoeflea sp.]|uniref:hypothetical protein n=1 Tax=Aliihoeflea sp. TaxID=2608088 RepID=UPI004033440C
MTVRDIATAAAFGFGASAGRDLWRWLKYDTAQAFAFAVLTGALTLPALAGRGLTEGHERGLAGTVAKTIVGNVMLLGLGVVLAWACLVLPTWNEANPGAGFVAAFVYAVIWSVSIALIGSVWGLFRRRRRKRAFGVARQNRSFLVNAGIIPTKAKDATHVGPDAERLRLLGNDDGNVVFMVVGRRSKRAYISMDREGRFLEYTGPISV